MPLNLDISGIAPYRLFKSTHYYRADSYQSADGTPAVKTKDYIYFEPFTVSKTTRFDRLCINVTAGAADTQVILGIYADDGDGFPGALIAQTAAVATTSGAIVVDETIDVSLNAGIYHLAFVSQGGTTQPTISTLQMTAGVWSPLLSEGTTPGAGTNANYYKQNSGGTAMPAVATPSLEGGNNQPKILIRAA